MSAHRSHRRLMAEPLEQRRLLAADLDLDTGVLAITGSGQSDRIHVSFDSTALVLNVLVNKQTYQFDSAAVTGIEIVGRSGNDWISIDDAVVVNALIDGGVGNDRISGGGGDDTILGDKGNDRCYGGSGNDVISGGAGNDWLWGQNGDDVMNGEAGHDRLFGNAGLDQLLGGYGHDALNGGEDDDLAWGGAGNDRIRGGDGNDQLYGEAGKDQLYGEVGEDQLFGGYGNDKLWGGWDNDLIKGDAGNDHLNGGQGDNLLDGDEGSNHYQYGFVVDLDGQLVAELTSLSGATGVASFHHAVEGGAVEVELVIEVTGGPPSTSLDVVIDGVLVGSLLTDEFGAGRFELSTSPDQPEELPFPVDFSLHEGSTVLVGTDLGGVFVAALV